MNRRTQSRIPPTSRRALSHDRTLAALVACLLSLAFAPAAAAAWDPESARRDHAVVRLAQTLAFERTGVPSPLGLAYSSASGAFYVVESESVGRAARGTTDVVRLAPFELRPVSDRTGSVRLQTVSEPINIAYDARHRRLVLFGGDRLFELREAEGSEFQVQTLTESDAGDFGLDEPQGMAVDPGSGEVLFLDARRARIVRVMPDANGRFSGAEISELDLRAIGLSESRGLAFDPSSGHIHIGSGRSLYELTRTGKLVAIRDLSSLALANPAGMVFAPSGDLTDDPGELSLWVADSGKIGGRGQTGRLPRAVRDGAEPGQIVELSLSALPIAQASNFTAALVRTIDTAAWAQPSPDASGLAYMSTRDQIVLVDGEVEETVSGISHFAGANVWELTLDGSVNRTANISKIAPTVVPMTNEPTGVAIDPTTGHFFITDDNARRVYELDPSADGLVGTSDDRWSFFKTNVASSTNGDPEGIAFDSWRGRLFVADGVNAEIYEYTTGGTLIGQFDVERYGVADPEAVEFNPHSGTLFVLSNRTSGPIIVETTTDGTLLQTINVSAAGARKPAGLAYAPASDGSSVWRFYVADRGIDNNSDPTAIDGRIFELSAPAPVIAENRPPTVEAGPDRRITVPADGLLAGTASDDGLPDPPGSLTTRWSQVSGPATVTFAAADSLTTSVGLSEPGRYVLRLTAADGALSSFDELTITAEPDVIFADSFESGSFSVWSKSTPGGGDLSVSSSAALRGSYGMQALINDNDPIFVIDERPEDESRYRARFHFDPNSIPMAKNDAHAIFQGRNATGTIVLRVEFRRTNTQYQIRAALLQDTTSYISTPWFGISDDPHAIELDWEASKAADANNGGLTLWIDGSQRASLTGVDNDTRRIDSVRLGALNGIDPGTRGTYFFDAFESRRVTFIGS